MGQEKTKTNQESQTKYTPTPEEQQLQRLQLDQAKAFDPYQRQIQASGGELITNLLKGQSLPGYLNTLPGGISSDVTQGIVDQSLKDIAPQFQSSGILDSGVAAQIAGRTAGDIRNQSAQFNLQNLMQLLNLAVGGQAQVQAPSLNTQAQLGQSLSGLRQVNQSGSTSTFGMNPFLKSFQTSFGEGLGKTANTGIQAGIGSFCWVASEIFGGWEHPQTVKVRFYFQNKAPKWLLRFYINHGKRIAEFIHNKPVLKGLIKPIFEYLARESE